MNKDFYPLALSSWDQDEVDLACQIIKSQQTTMGQQVKNFESEFSAYLGCEKTYMVNSGSSANLLMAMALKIYLQINNDSRNTIVAPAVGWSTSYAPFIQLGFNVKLIDVDLSTYNLDPLHLQSFLGDDVVAVLVINILGNPAPLNKLSKLCDDHNVYLLEDNCESLGAKVLENNAYKMAGSFGIMSTHSFFFSHHINTMEGGCVCTSNGDFSLLLKIIRNHGWIRDINENDLSIPESPVSNYISQCIENLRNSQNFDFMKSFYFILPGFNFRPTEIQGALGSLQLSKLPKFVEQRRKNATYLLESIKDINLITPQNEHHFSSYFGFGFIVAHAKRDILVRYLAKNGVQVRPIVSGDISLHPLSQYMTASDDYTNARTLHQEGFFIGNHHVDFQVQISKFVDIIKEFKG